jgi:hypothetical protein
MNRLELTAIVIQLAKHFDILQPTLRWRRSMNRSSYVRKSHTIWIAPYPWRGATDSILHEFAHALTEQTYHFSFSHGECFKESLLKVAKFYYGNPRRYGWHTEYEDVYSFGVKRLGLGSPHLRDMI